MSTFLKICTSHPTFGHRLFDRLAAQPLTAQRMKGFWDQMAPFCASTRSLSALAHATRGAGLNDVASMLDEIDASESGHAIELDGCAAILVGRASGPLGDRQATPEVETAAAITHFERRNNVESIEGIAYWLGATFAIEVMANRSIIPGEIRAFVESGFYAVSLGQLTYLEEHAGEAGAEADHERIMECVLERASSSNLSRAEIERGIRDTMDKLGAFYDALQRVSV